MANPPTPELVQADVVYETLLKLQVRTDGTLAEQTARLVEHFDGEVVQCDKCLGWSDPTLDRCPFCGEGDEAPPVAATIAGIPPAPTRHEDPPMTKLEVAPAPAPADEDKPLRAQKRPLPAVLPETLAASTGEKTKQLDAAVTEIKQLQRGFHSSAWDVGQSLARIYESDLWKTRRNDAGEVAYKNFEAFTRAELDIGRKYAQDLIKIAARFTREDTILHGTTKLRLVLQAPEEQQGEILGRLQGGATQSELASEVREAGDKAPTPHRDRAKKAAETKRASGTARPKPSGPVPSGAMTIAVVEGKKLSRLYAKPTGKNGADDLRPATTLADVPWGHLDLSNDVRMFFTIVQAPSGELSIRHDFRRTK